MLRVARSGKSGPGRCHCRRRRRRCCRRRRCRGRPFHDHHLQRWAGASRANHASAAPCCRVRLPSQRPPRQRSCRRVVGEGVGVAQPCEAAAAVPAAGGSSSTAAAAAAAASICLHATQKRALRGPYSTGMGAQIPLTEHQQAQQQQDEQQRQQSVKQCQGGRAGGRGCRLLSGQGAWVQGGFGQGREAQQKARSNSRSAHILQSLRTNSARSIQSHTEHQQHTMQPSPPLHSQAP